MARPLCEICGVREQESGYGWLCVPCAKFYGLSSKSAADALAKLHAIVVSLRSDVAELAGSISSDIEEMRDVVDQLRQEDVRRSAQINLLFKRVDDFLPRPGEARSEIALADDPSEVNRLTVRREEGEG